MKFIKNDSFEEVIVGEAYTIAMPSGIICSGGRNRLELKQNSVVLVVSKDKDNAFCTVFIDGCVRTTSKYAFVEVTDDDEQPIKYRRLKRIT